ncbi:mRNA capping enzyme family protein [Striga hermonthica]|uniref:mRNA guanylyltransferase n=1 Tax=Striga hermonthica TaxID=68872 RepID=A0A9N7N5U9_STRHE|nr:mRNA capping enzyme family protein [Striga hermonthica]
MNPNTLNTKSDPVAKSSGLPASNEQQMGDEQDVRRELQDSGGDNETQPQQGKESLKLDQTTEEIMDQRPVQQELVLNRPIEVEGYEMGAEGRIDLDEEGLTQGKPKDAKTATWMRKPLTGDRVQRQNEMEGRKPELRVRIEGNDFWVRDLLVDGGRRWDTTLVTALFKREDAAKILAIEKLNPTAGDTWKCNFTEKGMFSVKKAYSLMIAGKFCRELKEAVFFDLLFSLSGSSAVVRMDLNASPEPEEDDVFPEPHSEEENVPGEFADYNEHAERGESAVQISRREREERMQRIRRQRPDEKPAYGYQSSQRDAGYQVKRQRPSSRLPPGWLDCPAFGQEIRSLVPSKVPLGEAYNDDVPPGKRYSFRQVIHQQRVLGRKLGLVIDLTNSSRYYNVNDFKNGGMKHVKIACKGRDSVPENEAVNKFFYEVFQFLSQQNKQQKKYILVHCTHGHNRTGYMIVHYLMRTLPISVSQAIKIFADARPPGIYKPDYIDSLYDFYHEKKPDMVVCPPTPEWKRSSDLDLNGVAMPDDDDEDGDSAAPVHETKETQQVMTNDDILGDKIPFDQELSMRHFCYRMMKLSVPQGARGPQNFPGSHPVSLNRDNLQLLRQRYYYATWKADGTRYMMLITMDGCYLIDRHFTFRRVQMRFPCRHANEKGMPEKMYHHYTLLDGEMIIDTVPDSQKQERRYLIYDMMAINNVSIVELPFYERWKMLEKEVIEPRNLERHHMYQSQNPYYRYDLEPFRVRRKDFWLLSTVTKLLKGFIPKLSHAADGLVFQGWDDAYVPRTHEGLLKWKYPEMNSVDFLFEVVDDHQLLSLFERGKKKLMDARVVFPDGNDPSTYSGKIIECSWNSEEGVWVCMRVRIDKGTPNEFNTYKKVMRSIKDNITEDVLLNEINEIIRLPMYADRIQNESKAHQHNSARRR